LYQDAARHDGENQADRNEVGRHHAPSPVKPMKAIDSNPMTPPLASSLRLRSVYRGRGDSLGGSNELAP
jgi:hypothetical protein